MPLDTKDNKVGSTAKVFSFQSSVYRFKKQLQQHLTLSTAEDVPCYKLYAEQ